MAADTITVSLSNVALFAYIGVFEQERLVGNEFHVDVDLSYPAPIKVNDSDLNTLISYADIYEMVKDIMAIPCQLIETKVQEISYMLRNRWPKVTSGRVKITKVTPPIPNFIGSASVEYEF